MAWPQRGRYSARRGAKRLPEKLRQRILRRDPICKLQVAGICSGRSEQVDHIVAVADGGSDEPSNLQGVCGHCHAHKSARHAAARASAARGDRHLRELERHPGVLP